MKNPTAKQVQAIQGMASAVPGYFDDLKQFFKDDRDFVYSQMDTANDSDLFCLRGQARKLTDIINDLESLSHPKR